MTAHEALTKAAEIAHSKSQRPYDSADSASQAILALRDSLPEEKVQNDTQRSGYHFETDRSGLLPRERIVFDKEPQSETAASATVPEGWKLVPVEPDDLMLVAAREWSQAKYGKPVGNDGARGCYKAMLAAVEKRKA